MKPYSASGINKSTFKDIFFVHRNHIWKILIVKIASKNNGMTSNKTRPLSLSLKTLQFANKTASIADKACTI